MSSSRRGGTKLLNCKGASGRETHAMGACLISQEKGDARHGGASRTSGTRVSFFLLNMHKKNIYKLFSMGCPLRQQAACPLAHIWERMCANGHVRARCKKNRGEHKPSDIFEALRLSWV
jgi:hypothetical protein